MKNSNRTFLIAHRVLFVAGTRLTATSALFRIHATNNFPFSIAFLSHTVHRTFVLCILDISRFRTGYFVGGFRFCLFFYFFFLLLLLYIKRKLKRLTVGDGKVFKRGDWIKHWLNSEQSVDIENDTHIVSTHTYHCIGIRSTCAKRTINFPMCSLHMKKILSSLDAFTFKCELMWRCMAALINGKFAWYGAVHETRLLKTLKLFIYTLKTKLKRPF